MRNIKNWSLSLAQLLRDEAEIANLVVAQGKQQNLPDPLV